MQKLAFHLATLVASAALGAQLPPTSAGDLLVSSSSNHRLLRLAFDGKQLGVFSYKGLAHPRGVVVGKGGTVFLVSQNSDEVLVLDRKLQLVRRFATKNVKSPTGAALGPNGNLYVAGFSTSNVGEYKTDGTYVRTYTATGLSGSNCVAFGPSGQFYVASAINNTVVHFDAAGKFVRSFTGYSLNSPMGIALWKSELYVAGGGSSNIVVFDLKGKALRQIRHKDISGPQGIAFAPDGTFAVSGYFNNKVAWYRANGAHVRTVLPKDSKVPRSIAFLPGADLETTGKPVLGRPFPMKVRSPFEPGLVHVVALALGTKNGIKLPDSRVFPLDYDPLFLFSVNNFPGFVGVLDKNGAASVPLFLPDLPWLRGVTIHAAALTADASHATLIRQFTDAASWTL